MSAMALEARIANLEGTVGQIGQRLTSFDARFTNVERKIDVVEERLSGRIEQLDRRFTWMMGLLVVSMLLPVVEHFALR
jgi:flagellar capping protein FliD